MPTRQPILTPFIFNPTPLRYETTICSEPDEIIVRGLHHRGIEADVCRYVSPTDLLDVVVIKVGDYKWKYCIDNRELYSFSICRDIVDKFIEDYWY